MNPLLLPLILYAAGPVAILLLNRMVRPVNILTGIQLASFGSAVWLNLSPSSAWTQVWFVMGNVPVNITLLNGATELKLLAFVCLIGTLVTIWSGHYFGTEKKHSGFYFILSLFMFAMCGLLVSGNMLQLFCMWELVGLCSYLLIGYYRSSTEAGEASFAAMLTNKIGDAGFLIALMACWTTAGSLDIQILQNARASMSDTIAWTIGIGLLLAIASKSAQFPMHGWLSRAMAGPTPASALIHSATMVAAGVYLFWRLDFLLISEIKWTAGLLGLITALLGGWNALTQFNLKKILAWSTLSQLGLMIMAAGWGNPDATLLHLQIHGVMKAGLFMLAGSLVMRLHRKDGTSTENELELLSTSDAVTRLAAVALIAFALALTGLPLTTGFLSKEGMLGSLNEIWAITGFFVVTILTVMYLSRFLLFVLRSKGTSGITNTTWRELLALSIPILAVVWYPGANSLSLFNPQSTPEHGMVPVWVGGIWVLALCALAFFVGKSALTQTKFRPIDSDRYTYPAVAQTTLFLSRLTEWLDKHLLDRITDLLGKITVVVAHLIAFTDRWLVDGTVRLLAKTAASIGTIMRLAVGRSAGNYLWWTFTALLILLFWQT